VLVPKDLPERVSQRTAPGRLEECDQGRDGRCSRSYPDTPPRRLAGLLRQMVLVQLGDRGEFGVRRLSSCTPTCARPCSLRRVTSSDVRNFPIRADVALYDNLVSSACASRTTPVAIWRLPAEPGSEPGRCEECPISSRQRSSPCQSHIHRLRLPVLCWWLRTATACLARRAAKRVSCASTGDCSIDC